MSAIIDGSSASSLPADSTINGVTVGKGAGTSGTVLGYQALNSNSASWNTAVGYQAGYANTTGTANAFFGSSVGYSNTTGIGNAAFGANYSGVALSTLVANTTGSFNTAFGVAALGNNTTASYNTAVGYQAGYSVTTQVANTFIGQSAGYSTTGARNTLIGNGAGYYISSGAKNTVVGQFDGNQGGLDIRTANNFIVLSDGDGNPRLYNQSLAGPQYNWYNTPVANAAHIVIDPNGAGSYLVTNHPSGAGSGYSYHLFTYNGTTIGQINQNGTTAVTYATTSDYRLKENVAPMTGALAKVLALKPVTYIWKSDGSDGEGFIAHELAEVCPHAVTGEKDAVDKEGNPKYQGIDTSFLVATLTAAIQELKAEIDALKAAK